ncbi:hypothetical protein ACWC9U_39630 [Streptomyces sp. 900116325]
MNWQSGDGRHEGFAAIIVPDGGEVAAVQGATLILEAGPRLPASETLGWRSRCTCGWMAPLMFQRVTDPDAMRMAHQVLDLEGGSAPPEVEETCHAEWLEHIRQDYGIEAVRQAAAASRAAERSLEEAVKGARAGGHSWTEIGEAIGISRQSAHERWRGLAADQ